MAEPYAIVYAREAADDLRAMRAFDSRKILNGIAQHLTHEPTRISRSRIKLMIQPFWSQYRLRVDEFRVYYDVDVSALRVNILRVLKKGSGPMPQESP